MWTPRLPARRARRAPVAALAVLGVMLGTFVAAPAAVAKRTTTSSTTTTVPTAWDPRLQPIADKVAELRHLTFDHPVAAEFLDEATFEKRVAVDKGKLTKQDKADLARAQGQLRAIGLIGPDVDIIDAVSSLQSSGVLAYYNPKTKKIVVKGTNLDDVSTRVTVAHELTHALQDQHFDLRKLQKAAEADHGSTALRALAEGDAVRIQTDYEHSLSDADQQAYTTQSAETSRQAQAEITAKGVPDSLNLVFQAPYALGQPMLQSVISTEQVAGIDALFQHPPTADAAFVTPSTLLDHHVFQTVERPALQAGEKRSGKPDVFGSLALFQVLSSRLDNATALSAADAWDGDSMVTFTRKGATCLRATFAGRGTDGTATITNALNGWSAQMPAGSAEVSGAPDRVTLTACDPGSAATAIPNKPIASLVFLASRDGFFSEVVKAGRSVSVATCAADTLVRDPVFAPIVESAGNDPNAAPDPAVIAAAQSRARQILAECSRSAQA